VTTVDNEVPLLRVHVVTSLRSFVGIGWSVATQSRSKVLVPQAPELAIRASKEAAGAFSWVLASPPAKPETTAAMMIVTTSISITPMTGETASSFFFLTLVIVYPSLNSSPP